MKVPVALALPDGLVVTEIEMIDEVLTLTAVSVQIRACCPLYWLLRVSVPKMIGADCLRYPLAH
jgi:hypothetical protein